MAVNAPLANYVETSVVTRLRSILSASELIATVDHVPSQSNNRGEFMSSIRSVSLPLAVPSGAEYSFTLYFSPEFQIHAHLLNAPAKYFWYMPFEEAGYRNSVPELTSAFLQAVSQIAENETRIVQKHRFVWESFRCDWNSGSNWNRIYGLSYLRWFEYPQIRTKEHTYYSPPIVAPRQ